MMLFHGSNAVVEKPNLELSRKSLDFGSGFYTTVSKEQAIDFAQKVAVRKRQNSQTVSVYDFDMETAGPVLDILTFPAPDRLWLDFVHQNRRSLYTGKPYDLIIGPVANDDVFATLIVYEQGILNAEQTLEALKVKKLYSQLSHFQNSVSFENGFAVSRLWLRNMRFLSVAFPKTEVLEKPQFVFKTEKALSFLKFKDSFNPGVIT